MTDRLSPASGVGLIDTAPQTLSILVVEDEPGDFGLVNAYLRQAGFCHDDDKSSVVRAETLAEAILVAGRKTPDLILLDLFLTDSTGIETVKAMRAALSGVPIVAFTGHDDNDLAQAALQAGAQDFLIKGQFDHTVLARAVRHALVRGKLESQIRQMAAGLEKQVIVRKKQLRRVSAQLMLTEERERRLLAQELHDNLGQLLAVIKIKLSAFADGAPRSSVDQVVELVSRAEQSARMITQQLSPPILRTLGFVPALEWLAEEMERGYDLVVHFDREGELKPLADEVQAILYRSARELLINVARHAGVGEASLSVQCDENRLTLVVSDDGGGFEPASSPGVVSGYPGFGLSSIYERIVNTGGEMEIDSSPGYGAAITLSVPWAIAAGESRTS